MVVLQSHDVMYDDARWTLAFEAAVCLVSTLLVHILPPQTFAMPVNVLVPQSTRVPCAARMPGVLAAVGKLAADLCSMLTRHVTDHLSRVSTPISWGDPPPTLTPVRPGLSSSGLDSASQLALSASELGSVGGVGPSPRSVAHI